MQPATTTEIKAYSKKELRALYNVSAPTLRTWIAKILPITDKQLFTPAEIKLIFEHIGTPENATQ
jgi:hypothetical protein